MLDRSCAFVPSLYQSLIGGGGGGGGGASMRWGRRKTTMPVVVVAAIDDATVPWEEKRIFLIFLYYDVGGRILPKERVLIQFVWEVRQGVGGVDMQ